MNKIKIYIIRKKIIKMLLLVIKHGKKEKSLILIIEKIIKMYLIYIKIQVIDYKF